MDGLPVLNKLNVFKIKVSSIRTKVKRKIEQVQ